MNKASKKMLLTPGDVSLAQLRSIYTEAQSFELNRDNWQAIEESAQAVREIVARGDAAYGINTGFGLLAQTRVDDDQLALLQRNLVLSHCTGVGDHLDEAIVRLIICLKIISLSQGYSGISRGTVQLLMEFQYTKLDLTWVQN